MLSFLMQLGFRRVGQPCAWAELQSDRERAIAGHMMQLGLLKPFRPPPGRAGRPPLYFCPTRLASSLCDGFKQGSMAANADIAGGHVIVETNYRVYAFTTSQASANLPRNLTMYIQAARHQSKAQ